MDEIEQMVQSTAKIWREAGVPDPCSITDFVAHKSTPTYSSHWWWERERNGDFPLYGGDRYRVTPLENYARCIYTRDKLRRDVESGQLVRPFAPRQ